MMKSVAVVVPVYNGAATIERCVRSLLAQDYPVDRREVIVVENGSTDDTAAIVAGLPVRLLRSERRGPAPARNVGWRAANAEIVAFTDADCIADRGWLRALAAAYDDAAVGGAGGPIVPYVHAERSTVERFAETHAPLNSFAAGAEIFLPDLYTANASYRRSMLAAVGGFDPRLVTGDDVDLAWRVQLRAGARLVWAPDAVVQHHHRSTVRGLARQYRQYGFGEVLLDAMYRRTPDYTRTPGSQVKRMTGQAAALPRYVVSAIVRHARFAFGRESEYRRLEPLLCLVAETANLRGKVEALIATRFMRDAERALRIPADALVRRLFPQKKW
jgi:glycosyltransferase involved in cell wall biosynthesis